MSLRRSEITEKNPFSNFIYADTSCVSAVVVCLGLVDPDNGQLELSSMVFGSTGTYRCDGGYNLNGSMSHVCMADEK